MLTSRSLPRSILRALAVITLLLPLAVHNRLLRAEARGATEDRHTYFEHIHSVLPRHGTGGRSGKSGLSVDLTRLDVTIENGIAFYRLVQVYHNRSNSNQGFAFRLPIRPDTAITGFTIWDRGKPYPGVIDDRRKAEAVYKKVTGDEAPRMNRDPGLVRKTRGAFEMRVFPIFPDERKQIELYFTERLTLTKGRVALRLPLRRLTQPHDRRHGRLISGRTELSVILRDELPIVNPDSDLKNWRISKRPDGGLLLRLRTSEPLPRIKRMVSYGLTLTGPSHVTATTHRRGKVRYASLRVLYRPRFLPRPKPQTKASGKAAPSSYVGVWRSGRGTLNTNVPGNLTPEIRAFRTLGFLDPASYFVGAWYPPPLETRRRRRPRAKKPSAPGPGTKAKKERPRRLIYTDRPYLAGNGWTALSVAMRNRGRRPTKKPGASKPMGRDKDKSPSAANVGPEGLLDHLSQNLRKFPSIKRVILFVGSLEADELQSLAALIRKEPQRTFVLYLEGRSSAGPFKDLATVRLYVHGRGWIGRTVPARTNRYFLSTNNQFELMMSGMAAEGPAALFPFWAGLGQGDPNFPTATVTSPDGVRFSSLGLFHGAGAASMLTRFSRGKTGKATKKSRRRLRLVWLAGRYSVGRMGPARIRLELRGADGLPPMMRILMRARGPKFMQKMLPPPQAPVVAEFALTEQAGGNFAAMYDARRRARTIDMQRAFIRMRLQNYRRHKIRHDEQAELSRRLNTLRDRGVALSRAHSFITSETAFIALPEKLRRKYRIGPQNYDAGGPASKFNAGPGMSGGKGVPEPHEWLLLALIAALAAGFYWLHRNRARSVTTSPV